MSTKETKVETPTEEKWEGNVKELEKYGDKMEHIISTIPTPLK